ncbi:MAG TPA: hypothetical protein VD966_04175, partial [Pyrinomonadaceae bacterium]|nr:hypothetical protein [Pyrinomonadaceae bacterium]
MRAKPQVMKFGGTSVGDAECIRRAALIIATAARDGAVVAVVSAMSGVTNRLIAAARQSAAGDESASKDIAGALLQQHTAAIAALIKDETRRAQLTTEMEQIVGEVAGFCRGIALLRELTPRTLAAISSAGERLSARLLARTLLESGVNSEAVEATEVIVTDDEYGQAEPLMDRTRERAAAHLLPLIADGITPVVTGFIGATPEGTLTT